MNDDLWNRSASVSASPRFDFLRMRTLIDGLNKFSNKDCMTCHLNQGTKNLVVLLIRYNNRRKVIFHQHFCTSIPQTQLSKFPTNIFSVMKKASKKFCLVSTYMSKIDEETEELEQKENDDCM